MAVGRTFPRSTSIQVTDLVVTLCCLGRWSEGTVSRRTASATDTLVSVATCTTGDPALTGRGASQDGGSIGATLLLSWRTSTRATLSVGAELTTWAGVVVGPSVTGVLTDLYAVARAAA